MNWSSLVDRQREKGSGRFILAFKLLATCLKNATYLFSDCFKRLATCFQVDSYFKWIANCLAKVGSQLSELFSYQDESAI